MGQALANWASQVTLVVKNLLANAGDTGDVGSNPGWGRSSGESNGYPLQYSFFFYIYINLFILIVG